VPLGRRLTRALPAAVIALAAHAAAYGSLLPADGRHGPLALEEAIVAAASLATAVAVAVVLAGAVLRPGGRSQALLRALVARRSADPASAVAARLAAQGLALLLVQETAERSLAEGAPATAAMPPAPLLAAIVTAVGVATLLALGARAGRRLVLRLDRRPAPRAPRRSAPRGRRRVGPRLRRPAPLAVAGALRAPPTPA
jgi:hypothetical protein